MTAFITPPQTLDLHMPELTVVDRMRDLPPGKDWVTAQTTGIDGSTSTRLIIDDRVDVDLPDGFAGYFEVVLTATDHTRVVAVEGTAFLPLGEGQ